jgi:D-alanine-D-alanine ligase-like ATP-grasp enzyme
MSKDAATRLMPNFSAPDLLKMLSFLQDKHLDLATSYLTSLTALTLGMECQFIRQTDKVHTLAKSANNKFPLPTLYKVTSGKAVDYFHGSVSLGKLNKEMALLTKNKVATRHALASVGIRTPFGGGAWSEDTRVLDAISEAGVEHVLVKPFRGSLGRGIRANITVDEARKHIKAHPDEKFVVEQFIVGREYRIYTVGGKFSRCFARLRDNVVGNGRNTVRALFDAKQYALLSNPSTRAVALRKLDKRNFDLITEETFKSVPGKGQIIWLNDDLIPSGRDGTYEPTGVSDEVKKLARDVAQCVNGDTIAIDLIDLGSYGSYVLEVNAKPNTMGTCFPMNANWNLKFPEAVLRNSFPGHKDNLRRIKSYNYLQLIRDYQSKVGVIEFSAEDYADFY